MYFVTGANSGCGFEATRQLALHFSTIATTTTIYLLCRSGERANDAIKDIVKSIESTGGKNAKNVRLEFMKFDAYDDETTIRKNISLALEDDHRDDNDATVESPTIGGILLNAGGFGEGATTTSSNPSMEAKKPEACGVARLNLIGHVVLVRQLLETCKKDASKPTRIVAVGSEACFSAPGVDFSKADFVAHLSGNVSSKDKRWGADYVWTKGILALYWAAFARSHSEDCYVLTISPGAVPETRLLDQKAVSPFIKVMALVAQWKICGGSHTVQAGAQRYFDALMGIGAFGMVERGSPPKSGAFYASRKGFAGDFGDATTLKKAKFVSDTDLQDKAWAAVNEFV
jgi:NAD(P)-dependent dehydrogenase (short-subunit alcohol dehydrogenase family)